MTSLLNDLRIAFRGMRKSPGVSAVAVLTLALGVGANTALFSVVDAVLLRRLPYQDPSRLVMVWEHHLPDGNPRNHTSPANFLAWKDEVKSLASLAAFVDVKMNVGADGGAPEAVPARVATANVFEIVGVRAAVGRLPSPADELPDAPHVVAISHGLWQRRFGGDPTVVGRTVRLNGEPHTVVGVLPEGFRFIAKPADVWVPMPFSPDARTFGGRYLSVLGRLAPGATVAGADAEIARIARRRARHIPEQNASWTARVVPMQGDLAGDVRPALLLLFGAVGFLLLIACANVANLLLARAATRRREIAIRTSLGATRGRLSRQLLTESLALALLAALFGLGLGVWLADLLVALIPRDVPIPRLDEIALDKRVLGFSLALALLTGTLFGWIPALAATGPGLEAALREGGRGGGTGVAAGRIRRLLVVTEVALAVMLLVAAGLTVRSLVELRRVEPGFDVSGALTARIVLDEVRYPTNEAYVSFFQKVEDRLATLPGVRSVGAISYVPLSGDRSATSFTVDDRPPPPEGREPAGDMRAVTPGYFEAMGIPLLEGRRLTTADDARAARVGVVGEALARRFWPGERALGKRLTYDWDDHVSVEIVGVVGDVHHAGPATEPYMEIYLPQAQFPYDAMTFVVRATGDPLALAGPVRAAVRELDPEQPLADVRTLDAMLADSLGRPRLEAWLFGAFGALGLLLASVGIYGVLSYSVAQRTREMGIRAALGARAADVLALVVRQGAALVAAGLVVGLAGAAALSRLMRSILYGVAPLDAETFAVVATLIAVVALAASWVPARRATRVDPATALRMD